MQTKKVGFDAKNEMRQISLEKQLFGDSSFIYFLSLTFSKTLPVAIEFHLLKNNSCGDKFENYVLRLVDPLKIRILRGEVRV